MKILAIGDPHCKLSSLGEIRKLETETLRLIKERTPDLVVVLGDLHDTFEKAHLLAHNAMTDLLQRLSRHVTIAYVVGNHDMVNNQEFLTDNHFFKALKDDNDDLYIVDSPTWIKGCVFCPYVPNGRLVEALDRVNSFQAWKTSRAIFCHQEFKGAKLGAIVSEHGDEWDPSWPQVISGHVHQHQTLFGGKVLYVGTPYTTGFGESDLKTVSLFTFEDDGLILEERIDLGIPRKVTVHVPVAEIDTFAPPANTILRIAVEGTSAELATFKKSERYRDLTKAAKVVFKALDVGTVVHTIKRQSYSDLLKEACEREGEAVQKALLEVLS